MNTPKIRAIYAHFPFCRKVCPFCSFPVLKDQPQKHSEYIELVTKEIQAINQSIDLDFSETNTIYFGGGTPSRLTLELIRQWVDQIKSMGVYSDKLELVIEINPEDVTQKYIKGLLNIGFGRISIGAQSFFSPQLEILRRGHTADQSHMAIKTLIDSAIPEINIDFIFGYPGQTLRHLESDLETLIAYQPDHISTYSLAIEEKTALYRKKSWLEWVSTHEGLVADMYRIVVHRLAKAGYQQYEISNFSKPGKESAYNLATWNGDNYLGIGIGAHSFVQPHRWSNHRRWKEYKGAILQNVLPRDHFEHIDKEKSIDEMLMLGLRQTKGIDLKHFSSQYAILFSDAWKNKIELFQQKSLIRMDKDRLTLTLEGMILCDEITSSLAATL